MGLGKEFDTIIRYVNTEKTTKGLSEGKYCFEVVCSACKCAIKDAIEKVFGVKVAKVNVANYDGKVKRFKGRTGRRNSTKKAVVTLEKGQDINFGKLE